jgi:glycosyltransferase 2 family protein
MRRLVTPLARRRLWIGVQLAFVAAAFWYVGNSIVRQWADVRQSLTALHPAWGPVLLSGLLVLAAYAILIQTWRVMLRSWNAALDYRRATRIWFVSNLGKYVPGKVWQIAAMSAMAQREGVSPVAATGSALIVNLANILSGFVFVLAGGLKLLDTTTDGRAGTAVAIAAVLLIGLMLLPALLPRAAALAGKITRRPLSLPRVPATAVWTATVGTAAAWALYGVAFALLAHGVLPDVRGALWDYVAVYTISYLAGYLFVPAPGGLGVREWTMVQGMTALGLAGQGEAWVIAFASRLWLTVLEVLPGVLFVLLGGLGRPSSPSHSDQA